MRRIRSVAISVPGFVGPPTGVNATLTLLQHKYRVPSDPFFVYAPALNAKVGMSVGITGMVVWPSHPITVKDLLFCSSHPT
jgi:hypothetical protein